MFSYNWRHAIILDHKTGKTRALKYYRAQFNCYLVLIKAAVPSLIQGNTGIHWVKNATIEIEKNSHDIQNMQPSYDQLIQWLNDCTQSTVNFGDTNPGPLCPWCDYQDGCPSFQQGSVATHVTLEKEGGEAPGTNTRTTE